MQNYKAPLKEMMFAINDVLNFEAHYANLPNAEDASPGMIEAILQEAGRFAENVLSPINHIGDEQGCQLNDGQVSTPAGFKEAYRQYRDGGWIGLAHDEKYGGQGLPPSVALFAQETLVSANHAWSMYTMVINGAIATIKGHGSEALQAQYLPSLVQGQCGATMCLTEAHCGSDLGLLRTKAEVNVDGSYGLSGSKIFISGGDQDFTDNIAHLVLARLPDAPVGTKGISLFVVPKFKLNADGSLDERNTVMVGSIEEKMGIHGSATCVMNFDGAEGFLVGEPNRGLNCMFTFINESRLGVAQQGQGAAELSYQRAAAYAKERTQMRAMPRKFPDKPADPIIAHPDVRRMLLTQKSLAEGGRLLNYYCAQQVDLMHAAESQEGRNKAEQRLALLTPIAKGFLSEVGVEAANHGVQIFGGHGFVSETGMEQIARDVRITTIYEGTTGIQGFDLLGRKILGSDKALLLSFVDEINQFCAQNQTDEVAAPYVDALQISIRQWLSLTNEIALKVDQNANEVGAAAFDYLMLSGYIVVAYFWLRSVVVTQQKLSEGGTDNSFYEDKLKTANFYFTRILPRTASHALMVSAGAQSIMSMNDESFGLP